MKTTVNKIVPHEEMTVMLLTSRLKQTDPSLIDAAGSLDKIDEKWMVTQ